MIRRLIVSYVLLVAVALAAFTVPVAFTLTAQLRGDTEESVRREATTMALLLGDGDEADDEEVDEVDEETLGDRAPADRTVGAVRVRYATADLSDRLWRIWGFRAALAIGVLAVAAGLGAIVARLLTRPLRQLDD